MTHYFMVGAERNPMTYIAYVQVYQYRRTNGISGDELNRVQVDSLVTQVVKKVVRLVTDYNSSMALNDAADLAEFAGDLVRWLNATQGNSGAYLAFHKEKVNEIQ